MSANPRFDYCSNVTGVDWPLKEVSTKVKTKKIVDGVEKEVDEVLKTQTGGYLEVVYHLFSVEQREGPLVLRMRTEDRAERVHLPSLTPIWRSAEFQEREIFDLYGILFDGHPDLRRLLMWEEFEDFPMRRDYVDPDDYEYEPTAHDEVLKRAQAHQTGGGRTMSILTDSCRRYPSRSPASDHYAGDLLEISMGPQHPSTHGVFRMNVVLDGEQVVKLKPVFGYLHRNHEKIAETESYLGSMPYTDRLDYICSITNNWAYALAVEKLAGIQVPERAEYLRVITGELTRLQNHASLIGFLMQDMGASGTPLMYAFREREKILDLFEALTGARMMCNYMRFGGCRVDLPAGWLQQAQKVVDEFPRFLDEFERLLHDQRNSDGPHPGRRRGHHRAGDQRRHERPHGTGLRREL